MSSEDRKVEEQQASEQEAAQEQAAVNENQESPKEQGGPEEKDQAEEEVVQEKPAEDAGTQKEEKKGFFKKKKDPRDEKIEELNDRVMRQMAEFENFRKRTEKEKSTMYEMGARDMIEKILPIVDNFERGLASIPEDAKSTPFAEGMEKIYMVNLN